MQFTNKIFVTQPTFLYEKVQKKICGSKQAPLFYYVKVLRRLIIKENLSNIESENKNKPF